VRRGREIAHGGLEKLGDLVGDVLSELIAQAIEQRQPALRAFGGDVRSSGLVAAVDGCPRGDGNRPDRKSQV
jgi:hypothetical protein